LKKNKSAIKRVIQSEKRRLRNSHVKSTMKTNIKKVLLALKDRNQEVIESTLKTAVAYIDRAASKRVIHRNNAARRVSRLTKRVNAFLRGAEAQR